MPFKSERQRRYLYANKPEVAREFADKEKHVAKKPSVSAGKAPAGMGMSNHRGRSDSAMPTRSNKGGAKRGADRAAQVKAMNTADKAARKKKRS